MIFIVLFFCVGIFVCFVVLPHCANTSWHRKRVGGWCVGGGGLGSVSLHSLLWTRGRLHFLSLFFHFPKLLKPYYEQPKKLSSSSMPRVIMFTPFDHLHIDSLCKYLQPGLRTRLNFHPCLSKPKQCMREICWWPPKTSRFHFCTQKNRGRSRYMCPRYACLTRLALFRVGAHPGQGERELPAGPCQKPSAWHRWTRATAVYKPTCDVCYKQERPLKCNSAFQNLLHKAHWKSVACLFKPSGRLGVPRSAGLFKIQHLSAPGLPPLSPAGVWRLTCIRPRSLHPPLERLGSVAVALSSVLSGDISCSKMMNVTLG